MEWSLTIVALALIAVAAVSKPLSGSPITPAILFVSIGLLVGPRVLDEIDIASTSSTVRALAEATLALVLFSDASRIDLGELRREVSVPVRLLGIGLPLTIALGALAVAADVTSPISGGRTGTTLLLEEVGYGIVGGVAAALVIGAVVSYGGRRGLIDRALRPVIPAAGAALAYGTASALDGSGFIAAFVAGMVFRAVIKRDPGEMNRLTEEVEWVLSGVTFVIFGAILLGPAVGELSWDLAFYAVLSLTVLRMVPVAIAMLGTHARLPTLGFLGWFGPRGLASIVFAHGLTAAPLANRYADWSARHPD
jgi:NhaP-type Na+/H+ or K+/H+ antiporter